MMYKISNNRTNLLLRDIVADQQRIVYCSSVRFTYGDSVCKESMWGMVPISHIQLSMLLITLTMSWTDEGEQFNGFEFLPYAEINCVVLCIDLSYRQAGMSRVTSERLGGVMVSTDLEYKRYGFDSHSRCNVCHLHHPPTRKAFFCFFVNCLFI